MRLGPVEIELGSKGKWTAVRLDLPRCRRREDLMTYLQTRPIHSKSPRPWSWGGGGVGGGGVLGGLGGFWENVWGWGFWGVWKGFFGGGLCVGVFGLDCEGVGGLDKTGTVATELVRKKEKGCLRRSYRELVGGGADDVLEDGEKKEGEKVHARRQRLLFGHMAGQPLVEATLGKPRSITSGRGGILTI